jgi:hypothetical protein
MSDRELWRYYFGQLPWFTLTGRYRMPDRQAPEFEAACQAGAAYLRECLGATFTQRTDEEIARRASWVRLWRESGAYAALRPGCAEAAPARLEGMEHLQAALATGRPLVLLTAHVGNPYLACTSLAAAGHAVFPVARSVDRSAATPRPVQHFLQLNYRTTARHLGGHYLFTDFAGTLDKRIITTLRQPGALCVNLIDMPPRLYQGKRLAIKFLGRPAELPVSFVHWALRKQALFLTFWNDFEFPDDFKADTGAGKPRRRVCIDPPIQPAGAMDGATAESVLQEYAFRLERPLAAAPWNWMGLPIAPQFHEPGGSRPPEVS